MLRTVFHTDQAWLVSDSAFALDASASLLSRDSAFGQHIHRITGGMMGWRQVPTFKRILSWCSQNAVEVYAIFSIMNEERERRDLEPLDLLPLEEHCILSHESFEVREPHGV